MKLSELVALEEAYERRGYRVAFEKYEVGLPGDGCWLPDELTRDDENGWPTAEEAEALAATLRKVGGEQFRMIRVVGPAGEEVDPVDEFIKEMADAGRASAALLPDAPPPASLPVREGEPAEDKRLSLLAGSLLEDWCLVGSEDGGIYAVETVTLKGWASTRTIKWKMRKPTGTVLVGTEQVLLQPVVHGATGLRAMVGFHAASGSWWSAPQPRAE